jgi:hypothetical protein
MTEEKRRAFLWHLKGKWDKVMERVPAVTPIIKGAARSIAEAHRKHLGKSDKVQKPFKDFGRE